MTPSPSPDSEPIGLTPPSTPPPLLPQVDSYPPPTQPLSKRKGGGAMKWIVSLLIAAVVIGLIVMGGLAATCPSEAQLREALYGELGPRYKSVLESAHFWAKLLHLPHLEYHKHLFYSTLDYSQGGQETLLVSGSAGQVHLSPNVKDFKERLLSIPGVKAKLEGR